MSQSTICNICCEELTGEERDFYPCGCGYQVCLWCVKEIEIISEQNVCPACRSVYDASTYEANKKKWIDIHGSKKDLYLSTFKKGVAASNGTKVVTAKLNPNEVVTVHNAILVAGFPHTHLNECIFPLPDDDEPVGLASDQHFGRHGSILNMHALRIPKNKSLPDSISDTVAIWVTYQSLAQAQRALEYYCSNYPAAPVVQKYCPLVCSRRNCTQNATKKCAFLHATYRPPLWLPEVAKAIDPDSNFQTALSDLATPDLTKEIQLMLLDLTSGQNPNSAFLGFGSTNSRVNSPVGNVGPSATTSKSVSVAATPKPLPSTPTIIKPPTARMNWATVNHNQTSGRDDVFEDAMGASSVSSMASAVSGRPTLPPPSIDVLFSSKKTKQEKKKRTGDSSTVKRGWDTSNNKNHVITMDAHFLDEALSMKQQGEEMDAKNESTAKGKSMAIIDPPPTDALPPAPWARVAPDSNTPQSSALTPPDEPIPAPEPVAKPSFAPTRVHDYKFFDVLDSDIAWRKNRNPDQTVWPSVLTPIQEKQLAEMGKFKKPVSQRMLEQLHQDVKLEHEFLTQFSVVKLMPLIELLVKGNESSPEKAKEAELLIQEEELKSSTISALKMLHSPQAHKIAGCASRNVSRLAQDIEFARQVKLDTIGLARSNTIEMSHLLKQADDFGVPRDHIKHNKFLAFPNSDDVEYLQAKCLKSKMPCSVNGARSSDGGVPYIPADMYAVAGKLLGSDSCDVGPGGSTDIRGASIRPGYFAGQSPPLSNQATASRASMMMAHLLKHGPESFPPHHNQHDSQMAAYLTSGMGNQLATHLYHSHQYGQPQLHGHNSQLQYQQAVLRLQQQQHQQQHQHTQPQHQHTQPQHQYNTMNQQARLLLYQQQQAAMKMAVQQSTQVPR